MKCGIWVIDNWESQDEPKHLKTIRDRILNNKQRTGRKLGIYQQILQQGQVASDDSPEQAELRLSGLVVKQHGKLRVYNCIYKEVFDDNWVKKALADLRPYGEAIAAWLDSNCQDESRLLQGLALQEAKDWAADKSLSEEDYRFFDACQELKNGELERTLKVKEEESRILTEANEKANRKIQIGSDRLFWSGLVAIMAGIVAVGSIWNLTEIQEVARIQREAASALDNSSIYDKLNTERLRSAMRAGQDLQALVKDSRPLQEYPTITPVLALQKTLWNINDFNQQFNSVNGVSFSPDGQRLATTHKDRTVRIWDLSGKQLAVLKGHQREVASVSFSPDGQRIATVGEDKTARIWDLSGRQLTKIKWEQYGDNNEVMFSPDGQRLVGIEDKETVRVWNLKGKQLAQWKVEPNGIFYLSFSPDGQRLASLGRDDDTIKLWNFSGKQLAQWKVGLGGAERVDFTPNRQQLVTFNSLRDRIALWDLSGNQIAQGKVELSGVFELRFSPDGQRYATVSVEDDTVRLWDFSGKLLTEIKGQPGEFEAVSFSPDGQRLATGGYNGAVSIWDLSGKRIAEIIKDKPQTFDNTVLRLFELIKGNSLSFSLNGQRLATAEEDGTVRLWNRLGQQLTKFKSNQGKINQVSFSPDGQYLATIATVKKPMDLTVEGVGATVTESTTPDSVVQLWNLSGQPLAQLKGHQGNVLSVRFSPNGQHIATKGQDGTARVWDLSGQQLAELKLQGKVNDVSFSPDGQHLATVTEEGKVRLWELSGKQLAEWKVGENKIKYVSFSPNGQRLATAEEDNTVRIWDFSGRKLAELKGNQESVTNVHFSSDGQRIATIESDVARIWDLSGREIGGIFSNFRGFSPDGQYVAIQEAGKVHLERIRGLDELLAQGCDRLQDYFVTHPQALTELKVCQKK